MQINNQQVEDSSTKVVKEFYCIEKTKRNLINGYQYQEEGYQLQNGNCRIGIDALRELDKYDCASYPVVTFSSFAEVEKVYDCKPLTSKKMVSCFS